MESTEMAPKTVPMMPKMRPTVLRDSVLPCFLAFMAQMMEGMLAARPQQRRPMIPQIREASARLCAGCAVCW